MLRSGTRAARLMNRVLGVDLGQCCGGVVAVWLECFAQDSLGPLRMLEAQLTAGPAVLSTATSAQGVRQIVSSGPVAEIAAARLLSLPRHQAVPTVVRSSEGAISFHERLDEEYPAVWLFGAGHVGQALAGMLVQLPLRLRWQDSRPNQFPPGAGDFSRVVSERDMARTVSEAAPGTYFIVMTHDHGLDYELCRTVLLRDDSAWLGLIGSHSKGARFRSRLRRDAVRSALIEHLTCPIGVAGINSKWPAAIAVAVAAQLMQILSQPATGAALRQVTVAGSVAPCAAGNCETCSRHEQEPEGTVVSAT